MPRNTHEGAEPGVRVGDLLVCNRLFIGVPSERVRVADRPGCEGDQKQRSNHPSDESDTATHGPVVGGSGNPDRYETEVRADEDDDE